ncbi:MAG: hypothetical protein ACYDG6_06675 [Thermincolia bacterium]
MTGKYVKPATVRLDLGDKQRTLRFDLNALILLEEKFGDITFLPLDGKNIKLSAVRTLLWVGLVHEDESLTEKEVGSWIDLNNMHQITLKVMEAYKTCMPLGQKKEGGQPSKNG